MEFEQLVKLIDHISSSRLTDFSYEDEKVKISMKREVNSGDTVSDGIPAKGRSILTVMPAAAEADFQEKPEGSVVKSPLVGTFYGAPSESAEPFVQVGDCVRKGQILAIVEAMKLMNEIESDFDGKIAEIYVENGQAVEYGMPLFRIV